VAPSAANFGTNFPPKKRQNFVDSTAIMHQDAKDLKIDPVTIQALQLLFKPIKIEKPKE
jgi:hypothetical protein